MEITETYPTLAAAKAGIQSHEKQGHQVLHESHLYREVLVAVDGKAGELVTKPALEAAVIIFEAAPNSQLPLPKNLRAAYVAASTVADKLAIIAERLGLA